MVPILECPDFSSLTLDPSQPLQQQLHRQLTEWICSGRLQPGTRLTASRQLARQLSISRNTVTQVVEQLKAEGFLSSHPGRGTFVSDELPSHVDRPDGKQWRNHAEIPGISRRSMTLSHQPKLEFRETLPFTPGVPDLSHFPEKIWAGLQRRHQDRKPLKGYGGSQGYLPLRQALAQYLRLSRGVRCEPRQILITNGAQEALSLCAQLSVDKGDRVILENPGYHRAKQAFASQGAELLAAPLINNHLDVDALRTFGNKAKVVYTTPTHQYPLGGIMPAHDRLRLLDWASNSQTWILEDDYDSEFSFQQKPVAALQGMAPQTPVLYMGSFSKTLFPSLRLGYLVVPEATVDVLIKMKNHLSGESPLIPQAVIADFIEEGHFVRHLRRMRNLYRDKWQHFMQLIASELHPPARPVGQSAGMHLVIETPGVDDTTLQQQLALRGFGSSALSTYYHGNPERQGLVLGFANSTPEQRQQCVRTLSTLIDNF